MDFYQILLEIMNEKSLNIPDVARATGLSDSTIRSIISRKTKNVSLDVAFKMHKGLEVSLERLNGEEMKNTSKSNNLSKRENILIENFNKLNDLGKNEANKRVAELTEIPRYKKEIWEEEGKEYLKPNAAHMREGATEEDIQHDNDIMNNDDLWND